jgi:hypothetical protein
MADFLKLEQIYRRRNEAAEEDALLYFPASQITVSYEVAEVLPPSPGTGVPVNIDEVVMVMLQPYRWRYPRFKLYYGDTDLLRDVEDVDEIESQYRPLLRYVSAQVQGVWPLAWIKPLDRLPAGWEEDALLVVFKGVDPTKCKLQYTGPAAAIPIAPPDICDAYCNPPANLVRWLWCKLHGCVDP